MTGRSLLRTLVFALPLLAASLLVRAQEVPDDEPLRYARVHVEGARVRNLADDKGVVVAEPPEGTLLEVHEELDVGWLAVEVPGGFAVWVYGRYLRPTDVEDVCEVTSNAVNIRPQPSSDVTNFPLPQRLHAGDRVRVIELFEPKKPLAETWVRVWSPPGVRAWIRTSATEPMAPQDDGAARWAEALALAPEAPPTAEEVEQAAVLKASDDSARAELERAREIIALESAADEPDFAEARAALDAAMERAPEGPVAIEARLELERVGALEEAAELRGELERERLRRSEEVRRERARITAEARKKDPLGHVFLSRGALLSETRTDGTSRYVLRFGGEVVAEVMCTSGRYDLELFAGYEVGVQGEPLASAGARSLPAIEVVRLEILARR